MILRVGVLALQGDFAEHIEILQECGAQAFAVRRSVELEKADGLIIPGGESTAIAKLTENNDDPIFDTICTRVKTGMAVFGTCMGSIFLAKEIEGSSQGRLALMDIKVRRNAFGPQRMSFQTSLTIPCLGAPDFPAVFIRAPIVLSCGLDVEVLARTKEGIIMARQNNMLITAFHPEITEDKRLHQYFLNMIAESKGSPLEPGSNVANKRDTGAFVVPHGRNLIDKNEVAVQLARKHPHK
jgi:pyridoxal 5'-phosphate synthase pdxT subunit